MADGCAPRSGDSTLESQQLRDRPPGDITNALTHILIAALAHGSSRTQGGSTLLLRAAEAGDPESLRVVAMAMLPTSKTALAREMGVRHNPLDFLDARYVHSPLPLAVDLLRFLACTTEKLPVGSMI